MDKTAKVLTENARQRIKKKNFALPGKGEGPEGKGSGSYPIPDIKHGRNALARAKQQLKAGNLSQAEYDEIVAKVHAKYPGIGKEAELRKADMTNARKVAQRLRYLGSKGQRHWMEFQRNPDGTVLMGASRRTWREIDRAEPLKKHANLLLEKAGALAPPEFRRGFMDQLEKMAGKEKVVAAVRKRGGGRDSEVEGEASQVSDLRHARAPRIRRCAGGWLGV